MPKAHKIEVYENGTLIKTCKSISKMAKVLGMCKTSVWLWFQNGSEKKIGAFTLKVIRDNN